MMKRYQVTLYTTTGKYKPVSCIITTEEVERQKIINKGVVKIAQKRYWTKADILKYGYTKAKMREVKEDE